MQYSSTKQISSLVADFVVQRKSNIDRNIDVNSGEIWLFLGKLATKMLNKGFIEFKLWASQARTKLADIDGHNTLYGTSPAIFCLK